MARAIRNPRTLKADLDKYRKHVSLAQRLYFSGRMDSGAYASYLEDIDNSFSGTVFSNEDRVLFGREGFYRFIDEQSESDPAAWEKLRQDVLRQEECFRQAITSPFVRNVSYEVWFTRGEDEVVVCAGLRLRVSRNGSPESDEFCRKLADLSGKPHSQ